jgi:hypothetical protein
VVAASLVADPDSAATVTYANDVPETRTLVYAVRKDENLLEPWG